MYVHVYMYVMLVNFLQYLDTNRHNQALAAWRNATLQRPKHTSAWLNIILLLDNLGSLQARRSAVLFCVQYCLAQKKNFCCVFVVCSPLLFF